MKSARLPPPWKALNGRVVSDVDASLSSSVVNKIRRTGLMNYKWVRKFDAPKLEPFLSMHSLKRHVWPASAGLIE